MSGQDGSRGYLYQAFASILEALNDEFWDKIYIEFKTDNDKVDIALEAIEKIVKTIQVKSSINLFSSFKIEKWLLELIDDYSSDEYLLYLIGQCDDGANKLIKSFEKKNNGTEDAESKKSLDKVDKVLITKKITIKVVPFERDILESIVRDSLNKYISDKGYVISHEGLDLIAKGIIYTFMALSTKGKHISKEEFDKKIFKWVEINSGEFLTSTTVKAEHEVMFYDKYKHSFSKNREEINMLEFGGYKTLVNSYINFVTSSSKSLGGPENFQ